MYRLKLNIDTMKKEKHQIAEDKQNIPKTGRIGRFAKILENETKDAEFLRIMHKSAEYGKYKPEEKALWWKNTVETLEDTLGTEKAIDIMKTCGSKCCGKGQRKTAQRLMQESSSIEEFLVKLSIYEVKPGELEYKLTGSNTIIGRYNKCFCGQVKKIAKPFKNQTYCRCSVEFNKQFFESAFNKNVEVNLRQSIISGGDYCEFEIKF